jgi:hypothetical protein
VTDFFAQLAARYRGDADVLQPRVPFRFEPAATALTAAGPLEDMVSEPARPAAEAGPELPGGLAAGPFRHSPAWLAGREGPDDPREGPSRRSPAGVRPVAGPPAGSVMTGGPDRDRPAARSVAASPPRYRLTAGEQAPFLAEHPENPALGASPQASPPWPAAHAPAARSPAARPGTRRPAPAAPRETRALSTAPEREIPRGSRQSRDVASSAGSPDTGSEPSTRQYPAAMLLPVPPGHAGRQDTDAGPVSSRSSQARRRQALSHPSAARPAGEEGMTVQVTIGRVEVRAAPPVPAERPAGRAATGPSLADYLRRKERSAGAPT